MNMYYFGPANQYIEAGYATSNLSTCRACKLKIQKEAVRLAYVVEAQNFHSRHWYHLNCFQLKPLFMNMDPEQQIYNLDQVEYDYDEVLSYVNNQIKRLKEDPNIQKPQVVPKPYRQKKIERVILEKKSQYEESNQLFEQNEHHNQFLDDYDEEQVQQRSGRKLFKTDLQDKESPPIELFNTHRQIRQPLSYNELLKKYMRLGIDKLKAELGLNTQPKNGIKPELAERCADGAMFGRIPPCPICRGGKPRYNPQSKTYKCQGYKYDNATYTCDTIFQQHQILRLQWREL